jgi:hypothetical protein
MKYFSILIFRMYQTKYMENIFVPAQFETYSGLAVQQQTNTPHLQQT